MDEPDPPASTAEDPKIEQCLNCGADLEGAFCKECGQSASVERYTLKSFSREIYHKFRSLDATATFNTFKALIVDGGTFVEDYLEGKRVGFTNPVMYFFYYFVIDVLLIKVLRVVTSNPTFHQDGATGFDLQIVALVSTVFWGFLWWVFFRKSGLNLVENVVAAIYYVAQVNIVSLIFLIVSALFASRYPSLDQASSIIEVFLYFGYGIYFGRQLLKDPLWKLIPKQLVLTVIYFVILMVVLLFDLTGNVILEKIIK